MNKKKSIRENHRAEMTWNNGFQGVDVEVCEDVMIKYSGSSVGIREVRSRYTNILPCAGHSHLENNYPFLLHDFLMSLTQVEMSACNDLCL